MTLRCFAQIWRCFTEEGVPECPSVPTLVTDRHKPILEQRCYIAIRCKRVAMYVDKLFTAG